MFSGSRMSVVDIAVDYIVCYGHFLSGVRFSAEHEVIYGCCSYFYTGFSAAILLSWGRFGFVVCG